MKISTLGHADQESSQIGRICPGGFESARGAQFRNCFVSMSGPGIALRQGRRGEDRDESDYKAAPSGVHFSGPLLTDVRPGSSAQLVTQDKRAHIPYQSSGHKNPKVDRDPDDPISAENAATEPLERRPGVGCRSTLSSPQGGSNRARVAERRAGGNDHSAPRKA
jgi:hypothetical protein